MHASLKETPALKKERCASLVVPFCSSGTHHTAICVSCQRVRLSVVRLGSRLSKPLSFLPPCFFSLTSTAERTDVTTYVIYRFTLYCCCSALFILYLLVYRVLICCCFSFISILASSYYESQCPVCLSQKLHMFIYTRSSGDGKLSV